MSEFVSYSQHADDYIAWQLTGKKKRGIVFEVGAFDGIHLSNSYGFEQLGWQSVCVEPNPNIFKLLEQNRPESLNFNYALASKDAPDYIDFHAESIGIFASCKLNEEFLRQRYYYRNMEYETPEVIKVGAKTLNDLILECQMNRMQIDIVSIDVEGFEMEVLNGIDLTETCIGVVIIEANSDKEKFTIQSFFSSYNNYVFVGSNHQNLFFINVDVFPIENIENLDFNNFTKGDQSHPLDDKLTLKILEPELIISNLFSKPIEGRSRSYLRKVIGKLKRGLWK